MPNRSLPASDLTDAKIMVFSDKKPEDMLFYGFVPLRQMANVSVKGIRNRGIQRRTEHMRILEIIISDLNEEEKKIEFAKIIIEYANILERERRAMVDRSAITLAQKKKRSKRRKQSNKRSKKQSNKHLKKNSKKQSKKQSKKGSKRSRR